MMICNDRRWPEAYRVMGLQGVELVALGYNTPIDHTGHDDIDGPAALSRNRSGHGNPAASDAEHNRLIVGPDARVHQCRSQAVPCLGAISVRHHYQRIAVAFRSCRIWS